MKQPESILKSNIKSHLQSVSKNMMPSSSLKLSESEMKMRTDQEFAINSMRLENGIQFFTNPLN